MCNWHEDVCMSVCLQLCMCERGWPQSNAVSVYSARGNRLGWPELCEQPTSGSKVPLSVSMQGPAR